MIVVRITAYRLDREGLRDHQGGEVRKVRDERLRVSRRVVVADPIASFEQAAAGLVQEATAQAKVESAGSRSGEDVMRPTGP